MSDTEPNEHDQKPTNSIFLELIITPTIGEPNQVAIMYFRYSDVYGHGNATEADRLRYLQTEIQARYSQLTVNSADAAGELRSVLREWAPNLRSPARFTIQIPGELNLPEATGAGQTDDAEWQSRVREAEYARWLADEQRRMVLRDQQRKQAEMEGRQRKDQEGAAAEVEQLQRDQDALRAELRAEHIGRQEAEGRLDLQKQQIAHLEQTLSGAQQSVGQGASEEAAALLGKLAQAYQTIDELEKQIAGGEPGQAGAPSWRPNVQPTPADAQPTHGDAAYGSESRAQLDDEPPPRMYSAVPGLNN